MEKVKKIINLLIPYVIILIISLLGSYLFFYSGLNIGDDHKFHFANIYEIYKTLEEGKELNEISGYLAMGLGSGTRLFYSPIPHYLVAIIAFAFNVSIINSYKFVLINSIFISGIFMYRFAMHYSKNNKILSIITASLYILIPYRFFDIFHRIAYAEAFAITFLPLFFMGLYDITHFDKKINMLAFIEVILGAVLLYLTHNITAFYAFICGIIYLLVECKNIIKLLKNKYFVVLSLCSVILIFGICSVTLVSQLELLQSDFYNITNKEVMWTDIESVTGRTKEQFVYSGFINVYALVNEYPDIFTISKIILGIVFYILATFVFVIIDNYLKIKIKKKYINHAISIPLLFMLVSLIDRRIEMYLGTCVFLILYLSIFYIKDINITHNKKEILKDKLFYYSFVMIIVLFIMMQFEFVWKMLPNIFLNIQFPWRLWALVSLFFTILISLVVYYLDYKKVGLLVLSVFVGLLLICSQASIDNRASFLEQKDSNWVEEINDKYLDYSVALGFNKEYLPQYLFDVTEASDYSNSLIHVVRFKIFKDSSNIEDYYYDPVVLEGYAEIDKLECFADKHNYNIQVIEDSLIQLPIFYYEGYEITLYNIKNDTYNTIKAINIDGFVSFSVLEGEYEVSTVYKGSASRQISELLSKLSILITSMGFIYALIEKRKIKKLQ